MTVTEWADQDFYVLKHVLPQPTSEGEVVIALPWSAELLSVGAQGADIVVWFRSFDTFTSKRRRLTVMNTGNRLPIRRATFLGTVQVEPHGIVWHVFDHGWVES